MQIFSNLKTGTKLTCAFLAVALIVVGVAAVGYVSIKSINAGMATLYADRLVCAQQLGNVNDAELNIQNDLYRCILVPKEREKLEQDIAGHIKIADNNIKQYEATYLVPDEERGLAEFRPAWVAYIRAVKESMRQVKAGNTGAALQSVGEGGTVSAAQHAVEHILDDLINVQVRVGIAVKQDGDRTFARASAIMTAAGVIGVLLAIALGLLMGRSITRPLARITGVARSVSGGDLDAGALAGITPRRDEIGILAGAFTLMTGQLKETLEGLRRLNRELQVSEEKYRVVADFTYDWETWIGLDHQFIYVSPSCERITGYTPDEFINDFSLYGRIVHPDDRELFEKHLEEIHVESSPGCRLEYRIIARNGEVRWIEHLCGNIFGSDGKWLGQRSNNRDITDRKRMSDELEMHRDHLEELVKERTAELTRSNAEMERFVYIASHDLQEPLRMVASYLQLVDARYRKKLDDDAREFIEFAVDGAKRMQLLINDLLSYSRVGRKGQPFQPIDCEQALQMAMRNLQIAIQESGAQITHDPLPAVMGDATQLEQLFQNLLGNALKFRRDDPPKIHVGAKQKKGCWYLSVQDNGIGIEAQYFDRIFVVFQRLHGRSVYPGTGIGLAICKKIVERHGGEIWVESEFGKGSTFRFTIPGKAGETQ
jgi:PAS domain S-box-containing protein